MIETEDQPMSMTQQAVSELSTFNEMISAVLPYGELTVAVNGIGQVEEAHKAVKKLNASIEKKRKELKAGALEYGRTVDSIAKQLSEKVDSVEAKLKAERDAFDAIEKAEKAAKEAAKLAAKQKRLDDMLAAGIPVDLAAADLPDEEWMWWFSKAKKQAAEVAERLEQERLHNEQRQKLATRIARMEALGVAIGSAERVGQLTDEQFEHDYQIAKKAVDDRRASQEAERIRQAEELRIRAEEIERQRLADEAAMAEQRRAMEAEREELRNQQEAIAREKALRQAEAEAEAAELRWQRRKAAAAPEMEKLEKFLQAMRIAGVEALQNCGSPSWSMEVGVQFETFAQVARQTVLESLE
jgi:hypothetical protein